MCIYVYICVYMCICVYIYICIYNIHTRPNFIQCVVADHCSDCSRSAFGFSGLLFGCVYWISAHLVEGAALIGPLIN